MTNTIPAVGPARNAAQHGSRPVRRWALRIRAVTARRRRARAVLVLAAAVSVAVGATVPAIAAAPPVQNRVVSENPVDWTPHALDGSVYQAVQVGTRIFVCGSFTRVRNADSTMPLSLPHIMAFNARTGRIDTSFRPAPDDTVHAMAVAPDGRSLYIGGNFSRVGGMVTPRVARISTTSGAPLSSFRVATISGNVERLALAGNRLIIGGSFQRVGGILRPGLASLSPASGAVTAALTTRLAGPRSTANGTTTSIKVTDLAVSPDQRRLIVIGNFNQVGGLARYQLAVLDLTTSPVRVANWSTLRFRPNCSGVFPTYLRGIAIAPSSTWFVITDTGGPSGPQCDSVTRFSLTRTGNVTPTWVNNTGGDTLLSAAITNAAVYVGGHQRWLNNGGGHDSAGPGAVSRPGIGAVSPTTGRALAWNPTKDRGVGVFNIYPTSAGIWITSDTTHVHKEYHGRIAFFPL
ncbi:MAG: hypothetical protein WCA46_20850 [Actinocatenispora sp.]